MPLSTEDANGYLDYAMELYDLAGDHVDRATLLATAVGALPCVAWGLTCGFGPGALVVTMGVLWVAWTIGYERGVERTLPLKAACYLQLMHAVQGLDLETEAAIQ
ncbi:MAG: hypothetical protein H7338_03770 [Candidatus Sericytochromatia bacterium]|nr:hypothetical protein [Candidatus Sericytochromatia bacterium]